MPRPRKHRQCRRFDADRIFRPHGIPMREVEPVFISVDEFEALRLCYAEGLDQAEAGRRMGISRGTVQRLLWAGRKALIEAIVNNQAIIVNCKHEEESDAVMCTHKGFGRKRGRCS
ncbi:DUF134 domain-containing protein [candidate division GN15 bacterium]|nr:DUF134 domain-containing protein [candidate division GN15 bacterium]